jgi:hypothetical protein
MELHRQPPRNRTLFFRHSSLPFHSWPSVPQTCRDKKIRIFDPRAGAEPIKVTDGHGGIKGSRVVWLGDRDRIATTGVSPLLPSAFLAWLLMGYHAVLENVR